MAGYLIILVTVLFENCVADMSPFELVSEYIKNHNPLQRPVSDETSILDVKVSLNLLRIESLDETKQQLTTTGWFYFIWTVDGLVWNESMYENISRVVVKSSDIFLPDLVVNNAVNNYGHLSGKELPVTIWSNGVVEWYAVDHRTTSCDMDVTKFPFDHQRCSIDLAQWFTFTTEVHYSFHDSPFTFVMYKENGEWQILDYSAYVEYTYNGTYQLLVFELQLGRRRAYYILTAILPACLLSVLNLLVFHVPPGSGEKLTLCVSIFLSYAVYLNSIHSLLPSVSDHVAIFSIYLSCMFVLKGLTVAAAVCMLHLHSLQSSSCIRQTLTKYLSPKETSDGLYAQNISEYQRKHAKDKADIWIDVVKRSDRILFFVFLSIFAVCSIGFFAACSQ